MGGEKLIEIFEASKLKAAICLGIDEVNIGNKTDESRQIICFIAKEMSEILYVKDIIDIDCEVGDYLEKNGYFQLVKILDSLNYF